MEALTAIESSESDGTGLESESENARSTSEFEEPKKTKKTKKGKQYIKMEKMVESSDEYEDEEDVQPQRQRKAKVESQGDSFHGVVMSSGGSRKRKQEGESSNYKPAKVSKLNL
jgi:hypothetical protein